MAFRISRADAVDALHQGIAARAEGKPVTDCPYTPAGSLTQQFLAMWWIRGWRRTSDLEQLVPDVD